jgi:hypothetical protein
MHTGWALDRTAEVRPVTDPARPDVAAAEILANHVEVAQRLPVPPSQAEAVARILDRLGEEIREAAGTLRGSGHAPISAATPGSASCDPWSIVDLVTHDLSRRGIKSRFGSEADLSMAAESAARLLEALGLRPAVPGR